MTSYVDVDLSEEALKEDVELQQAVETIMQKGAEAIISDVKNDVSGVYEQLKALFEALFPFIVYWSEDRNLLWIDMQHCALFWVLFVFSFCFLSPWQTESSFSTRSNYNRKSRGGNRKHNLHFRRKGNKLWQFPFSCRNFRLFWCSNRTSKKRSLERSKSTSSIMKRSFLHQNDTLSRQDSGIGCDEIEKDQIEEEDEVKSEIKKFVKRWPTILKSSPYRCLVLPPECKRVDKPIGKANNRDQIMKGKVKNNTANSFAVTDDNPSTRLVNYLKHIIHLFMLCRIFNFAGVGWTLIHWAQAAMKNRNTNEKRMHGEEQSLDEYEDEDESVASGSMTVMSSSNASAVDDETDTISYCNQKTYRVKKEIKKTNKQDSRIYASPRPLRRKKEKSNKVSDNDCGNNNHHNINNMSSKNSQILNNNFEDCSKASNRIETQNISGNEFDADYGDETLTKTPHRAPLQPFESHRTSRTSLLSYAKTNGARNRDALENYRVQGSRGEFCTGVSSISDPPDSFFFEAVGSRDSLRRMAVEVPVPDKNGFIVGDEFLPDNTFTPLLVFVNSRSGPQQGLLLTTQLRGLLNPIQIWDLADGDPENILRSFSTFSRLKILVCGGDGTVSWIVNAIDSMNLQRWPPIAILPLGTGNDLARIHGWGGGYNNESLIKILVQVSEGYVSWLDRWEMTIENRKGKIKNVKSFLNYLSVGADAQAALQVHMLREIRPQLFFSRIVNKAWYGLFGAEDIIKATSINIRHDISLIADGVEVPLPADSQGIIMLNIDSYTGGVPLWTIGHDASDSSERNATKHDSETDLRRAPIKRSKSMDNALDASRFNTLNKSGPKDKHSAAPLNRADIDEDMAKRALAYDEKYERVTACNLPSSCQDGLLDIVSVRGTFHLGQIRVGLSTPQKLCQCREATIIIKRKVSVQIDGEPWRQNVCTLKVRRKKKAAIMLHRSADESNGVEMEVANLLDWGKSCHLIDGKVHEALMKEFSRRIENKTRRRRVQSNDNLMTHLKRAINSAGNNSNNHDNNTTVGTATGLRC